MHLRILKNSTLKRPKPVLLVLLSVVLGSAVATAFLWISAATRVAADSLGAWRRVFHELLDMLHPDGEKER